jgi:hypothetical protein
MVRLQEWAGLRRVVVLGVFVWLDCVCRGGQLLKREMKGTILLIFVDMRGQERRRRAEATFCLFTGHVPTRRLSRLLLLCWLRILMVRLQEWAGLRRVVVLGVFVWLDCVCGGGAF